MPNVKTNAEGASAAVLLAVGTVSTNHSGWWTKKIARHTAMVNRPPTNTQMKAKRWAPRGRRSSNASVVRSNAVERRSAIDVPKPASIGLPGRPEVAVSRIQDGAGARPPGQMCARSGSRRTPRGSRAPSRGRRRRTWRHRACRPIGPRRSVRPADPAGPRASPPTGRKRRRCRPDARVHRGCSGEPHQVASRPNGVEGHAFDHGACDVGRPVVERQVEDCAAQMRIVHRHPFAEQPRQKTSPRAPVSAFPPRGAEERERPSRPSHWAARSNRPRRSPAPRPAGSGRHRRRGWVPMAVHGSTLRRSRCAAHQSLVPK